MTASPAASETPAASSVAPSFSTSLATIQATIARRARADGGLADTPEAQLSRVDATAWGCLALSLAPEEHAATRESGLAFLALAQLADGRLPYHPERPQTFWPTAVALAALGTHPGYAAQAERAKDFLLSVTGNHWPMGRTDALAHDTSLRGWPWIGQTHSWVEPTAMAMLALAGAGAAEHPRVVEAGAMLLDRQIPSGGWNYGNTKVFGTMLLPAPESTGHCLAALSVLTGQDAVEAETVRASVAYLTEETARAQTPLSLSWGLLGLTVWNALEEPPRHAPARIARCIELQERYGPYSTTLLSQLALATAATAEGRLPAALCATPASSSPQVARATTRMAAGAAPGLAVEASA